ncbi:MAG: phosphatidate cytidylyltransferase [Clostridia bacterium]|nr:phosphatidate cytidylyltransferase [Clostridia bacterium]
MSKKVIPALIALVGALLWLSSAFLPVPIFAICVSIIASIGVYEIEHALGVKNKGFMAITLLFTAAGPIIAEYIEHINLPAAAFITVYIVAILTMMVIKHENMEFKSTAAGVLMSICLHYGFSCVVYLRDIYTTDADLFGGRKSYGMFFILFSFFCCWMTDTMAFFAGSFFGKHKMCPKISPNKTIEGAIGGVLSNVILTLILLTVFRHFFHIEVGYIFTAVMTIILSVISIFGDLAASVIKRQNGIKDFGNLLPGTGGVMDRFDSSMFVIPLLYITVSTLIEYDLGHFIFT